jgi:protein-tyrosine phosphatase
MALLIPPVNKPIQLIPCLYQSGFIFNERPIIENDIKVVFDLEGGFDPKSIANHLTLYVFWKIMDGPLPNLEHLSQLSSLAFWYHSRGLNVLTHCQMGLNRSSLFNGMVLWRRGWAGPDIIRAIKTALPLAFSNKVFKSYIEQL